MTFQARPYRDNTDLVNMRNLLVVGSQGQIFLLPTCTQAVWTSHSTIRRLTSFHRATSGYGSPWTERNPC